MFTALIIIVVLCFIGGISNEVNKNKANAYHAKKYDEDRAKEIIQNRERVEQDNLYKDAELASLQKDAEILRLKKEISDLKAGIKEGK